MTMVLHLAHPVSLAESELAPVQVSIIIEALSITRDLAILELTFVPAAITHKENSRAFFLAVDIVAFILEERVLKGVNAMAMAELCHRVQISYISVLLKNVVVFGVFGTLKSRGDVFLS
jgi:hypothetical protein